MLAEFIVLLGLVLFIFYKWSISTFDYFEKRNIPYNKPIPLIGNQKDLIFRKMSFFDHVLNIYKQGSGYKIFGIFDQRKPVFAIRDPSLIKQITVKDFDHFVNRRILLNDENGGLLENALTTMQNDKWKDMRSTLSPVFTGSKMRLMFTLINDVARESIEFLQKTSIGQSSIEINMKDYFTRFANDVIASAVFGLQVNSFTDGNNEFYLMGKRVTTLNRWQSLKFFLYVNFGKIMKALETSFINEKDTHYFMNLVLGAMKYRQEHKIYRPDMINMLMEAKGIYINKDEDHKPTTNKREWTDIEIVAQCFLFFFAGFETTSVLMSFIAHELMENPDVQERLRQEIIEVQGSLDGKPITYEALNGMKYLDMVISETLRRWPPAPMVDRQCTKDITLENGNTEVTIKTGDIVWFPIVGYHLDEKYFPNPYKFDPERFNDENKGNIQPFTYAPFGTGPRNCIGNRFALLETKAIVFYLLSKFRIEASPKTTTPMKLDTTGFNLGPKNGFWLKLVQLSKDS